MKISFFGAARQVTGSSYFLEAAGQRLLVDCGLYQERAYLDRNWEPFPVAPDSLDACLLTHAHLDHCGRLPRLVKEGFSGPIPATFATADLARIVLLDSAHIQEEDAAFKKKRHRKEGRTGPHPEVPLYTVAEAEETFPLFRPAPYGTAVPLSKTASVTFHDAGHILGSAMIEIAVEEKGQRQIVVFSGDIGQWDKPLVRDPSVFPQADVIVMESTYGDRDHEDDGTIEDILIRVIDKTVARGGNVVIPVFAVERAQEVLYVLGKLVCSKRIPRVPIFLDSPMAVEVTRLFARYKNILDEEARALYASACPPFDFPGLKLFRTAEESKTINAIRGSCIILAGSGMANAGRIKHHLLFNIERPESTVLFVGYQAQGTLGRQIVEGRPEVRINGRIAKVRAGIEQIRGFSGHAGKSDLMRWLKSFGRPPRRLFLTHGDGEAALDLAAHIERELGWSVMVPAYGDSTILE
jgi:metallo-beta-lactamase family protein